MRGRIPNALSIARILIAFVVLLTATRSSRAAYVSTVCLVTAAMLTDALDGYLARRWNAQTSAGYVLDAMGDRAIHLALVLVILVRYPLHPIFVWLLIFRDIAIYAVRVMSKDWYARSLDFRWLSVLHATNLRIWIAMFLVRDGVRVFTGVDALDSRAFWVTQMTLLVSTILLSYWGLGRSLNWLIDREHAAL